MNKNSEKITIKMQDATKQELKHFYSEEMNEYVYELTQYKGSAENFEMSITWVVRKGYYLEEDIVFGLIYYNNLDGEMGRLETDDSALQKFFLAFLDRWLRRIFNNEKYVSESFEESEIRKIWSRNGAGGMLGYRRHNSKQK